MNTVPSTSRQKTDDFLLSYALKRFCYSFKRLETFKVWNLQIKGIKHATYVTWNFSHESNYRQWHRSNWYQISWTDNPPPDNSHPGVIPPHYSIYRSETSPPYTWNLCGWEFSGAGEIVLVGIIVGGHFPNHKKLWLLFRLITLCFLYLFDKIWKIKFSV